MPGFPRPPSYVSVSQSELGSFQKFLEKPSPAKMEKMARKRREMPARRQDEHRGRLAWQVLEIFVAEAAGTGMLVFFGCMGLVSWIPDVTLPPFQGAIVFAVVVATIVQIFGHISAAHINPAVTIAFAVLGLVTPSMAVVYVFSQCLGAVLGFGLLTLLTPQDAMALSMNAPGLCCTVPHSDLSPVQALAMEFVATCFLVLVVCSCTDPRNANKADSAPLKFGAVILALSITVGPYTGASMNPARSLGPALWNGTWTGHWVYWLGPCLGGLFTTLFYQSMFNRQRPEGGSGHEDVLLNQVKVSDQHQPDTKHPKENNARLS